MKKQKKYEFGEKVMYGDEKAVITDVRKNGDIEIATKNDLFYYLKFNSENYQLVKKGWKND